MVMGPNGAQDYEWLCWRRPILNYCTALDCFVPVSVITEFINFLTLMSWSMYSSLPSYSRGPGLKSRPEGRIFSRKMPGYYLKLSQGRFLPKPLQFINHPTIRLTASLNKQ
jgi:hypothetical protein